jgi:parvulin-like peptidyl-prolyl isomerase
MSLNSFGRKIKSGPLGVLFFGLIVVCVGVLAFTGIGSYISGNKQDASAPASSTDVVATIDGTPISEDQFNNVLTQEKERYAQGGAPLSIAQTPELRAAAFAQAISPILLAQLAKENGLAVSDDEVAAERTKQLIPVKRELGLPSSATESDISSALENYGHTIDQIVNNDDIKTSLLAQKYLDHVTQADQANNTTVANYYKQVETRHILISNKTRPDAQAQALAEDLIARIKSGDSFVKLAKEYSDDPGTKKTGGEDGFIGQATGYVPEFKNAALALSAGEVTPTPVLSPQFGYFIIQAEAIRPGLPADFTKNHAQYVAQVTSQLTNQDEQAQIAAEKAKATIKIGDPRLQADIALSDPSQGVSLQSALADYNQALKSASDSDKAEIYASEAQIYQQTGQPKLAIASLVSALGDVEDSTLRLELGDLYKSTGQPAEALKQFQIASQNSYDDPQIHYQLIQEYNSLKLPKLAAKESAMLSQISARQRQGNLSVQSSPAPQ